MPSIMNANPSDFHNDDGTMMDGSNINILNFHDHFKNSTTPPNANLSLVNQTCSTVYKTGNQCGQKAVCFIFGKHCCRRHAHDKKRQEGLPCCAIVDIDTAGNLVRCGKPTREIHFERRLCSEHFKIDMQNDLEQFPDDEKCSICLNNHTHSVTLETYETRCQYPYFHESVTHDKKKVCKLSCGHVFHTECILNWFENGNSADASCPYCRSKITVETGLIPFNVYKNRRPIKINY